jgi:hypothetical protein
VLPLGLPPRFLPPGDNAEPKSAPMARLNLSRSFFKSETNFARSKVRFLIFLTKMISISRYDTVLANELTWSCYLDGFSN